GLCFFVAHYFHGTTVYIKTCIMKRSLLLSLALLCTHMLLQAQKDSTLKFTTFSSSRTAVKAKALYIDLHTSNAKLIKQKLGQCKSVVKLKITGSITDSLWD